MTTCESKFVLKTVFGEDIFIFLKRLKMYNCTSIWSILPVANRAISAAQIHRRFFILLLHSWVFYWEIADKKTKNKFPDERWRWFQMRFLTLLSCLCVERRIIRSWIQTIMSEYCLNADNRLMLTLISIHLPIYYLAANWDLFEEDEAYWKRNTHKREKKRSVESHCVWTFANWEISKTSIIIFL